MPVAACPANPWWPALQLGLLPALTAQLKRDLGAAAAGGAVDPHLAAHLLSLLAVLSILVVEPQVGCCIEAWLGWMWPYLRCCAALVWRKLPAWSKDG
jgi:hypothetical protein